MRRYDDPGHVREGADGHVRREPDLLRPRGHPNLRAGRAHGALAARGDREARGGVSGGVGRLLVSCTDRPGIVAALSTFLRESGANILQSDQHTTDPEGGIFFMRTEFHLDGLEDRAEDLERAFAAEVAGPFGMDWRMHYAARRKRVAILVSRYDHCLAELLWRWRRGELYADIPLVVSNHADMAGEVARFEV